MHQERSELVRLIAELVRIDSVNPQLDTTRRGEGNLARFVADWSEERGLQVEWLEPQPGRPSVIVRARGTGGGRALMLNAHLDTVGVTGMESPFEPVVHGGRMYGRGVMDVKASLAACMLAVDCCARLRLPGDVVLTAVADEEYGSLGTEAALTAAGAHAAIVTEPTDLQIHVAHRGFAVFEVELEGRASHTSKPEEGRNALVHLGRLLGAVEERDRELRRRVPHPLLAYGCWQPVLAQGGQELFTTPAGARVTLERRTLPGETTAQVAAELDEILAALSHADPAVSARAITAVAREAFETPTGSEIEIELASAVREVSGHEPKRLGAPYWTDAALIAATGIPTVLFGPVGGAIHQPGEWVDLASAETVRTVLERVATRFCG